jgi:hypothetical protein
VVGNNIEQVSIVTSNNAQVTPRGIRPRWGQIAKA